MNSLIKIKLLLLSTIAVGCAADSSNYRYIVFGDSLSDSGSKSSSKQLKDNSKINIDVNGTKHTRLQGNNYWLAGAGLTDDTFKDYWGAPITSFDYKDKTSFGKTWLNYFSESNNQKLINYRAAKDNFAKYLSDQSYDIVFAAASAQSGLRYTNDLDYNYFYNGATAPFISCNPQDYGKEVSENIACTPNTTTQVQKFLKIAKTNNYKDFKKTRVILWVGGNDVNGNILKILSLGKLNIKKLISQIKAYHPSLLNNNISLDIKLLKQAGVPAKNIYVVGLPNFKYVPAVRDLISGFSKSIQTTVLNVLSIVSLNYNNSMRKITIEEGTHFFDFSSLFIDLIKNRDKYLSYYGKYATDDALVSCTATIDNPLADSEMNFPLCKGFMFYNNIHPTTYSHKIIADKFKESLAS